MTEIPQQPQSFAVVHGAGPLPPALARAVIAIGNFDGVHRGHRAVIAAARARARTLGAPAARARGARPRPPPPPPAAPRACWFVLRAPSPQLLPAARPAVPPHRRAR